MCEADCRVRFGVCEGAERVGWWVCEGRERRRGNRYGLYLELQSCQPGAFRSR